MHERMGVGGKPGFLGFLLLGGLWGQGLCWDPYDGEQVYGEQVCGACDGYRQRRLCHRHVGCPHFLDPF